MKQIISFVTNNLAGQLVMLVAMSNMVSQGVPDRETAAGIGSQPYIRLTEIYSAFEVGSNLCWYRRITFGVTIKGAAFNAQSATFYTSPNWRLTHILVMSLYLRLKEINRGT